MILILQTTLVLDMENKRLIKAECPSNVNKEKGADRKFEKKGKVRKAYIPWQDNDDSSSSSSSKEDGEVNQCLMANEDS